VGRRYALQVEGL